MEIYISRDGQQFGPYTIADLEADLNAGNIVKTDLAWYEGAPDWIPVSELPGLYKQKTPAAAARHAAQWAPSAQPPQQTSSPLEIIFLGLLSLLVPPVGIILGIIRLSRKRTEGWIFIGAALLTGLLSLSIPIANFRKARALAQANACISNLRIIDMVPAKNLLLVRGAVPGPNGGLVMVRKAIKVYGLEKKAK